MEETISLKELLDTLKKRLVLIISLTLVAGIVSGLISFYYLTPIYQASTQILVNQSKKDQNILNYSDVQTNLQLINTYNVIITSPAILDEVAADLDLGLNAQQLKEKITVGSEKDSQVVNVSVQDPNPKVAAEIANKTADVFETKIKTIMNVDNVSILTRATVEDNPSPIKPKPLLNVAIAIVVGLMAGVGIAFLLEYFNNTLKNEQEVEKVLGLPILGIIAQIDDEKMEEMRLRRQAKKQAVRGETVGS